MLSGPYAISLWGYGLIIAAALMRALRIKVHPIFILPGGAIIGVAIDVFREYSLRYLDALCDEPVNAERIALTAGGHKIVQQGRAS